MTLQQKLLAKQSKKGFTLVELVVVIAILAILAAIAIPAVVNIIQSASSSAGDSDASTLNSACKNVYAGVKSGSINNTESKNADNTPVGFAAAKGASNTAKQTAANAVKVDDVQKYNGTNLDYTDFHYITVAKSSSGNLTMGTIYYWDGTGTDPHSGESAQLAGTTTLGNVGGTAGLYN